MIPESTSNQLLSDRRLASHKVKAASCSVDHFSWIGLDLSTMCLSGVVNMNLIFMFL